MAASSPSSLAPPAVPIELHAGNRDRLVAALRDHLSASGRPPRGLVLLQDTYKVDMVFYVDEITHVVQDSFGDHGKPFLFLLYGKNTDSGNFSSLLVLSAVLHYGHAAAPNDRVGECTCSSHFLPTLNDGDIALMDMGAEYHFYGSDITCSYPLKAFYNLFIFYFFADWQNGQYLNLSGKSKFFKGVCNSLCLSNFNMEIYFLTSVCWKPFFFRDVDDMMAQRLGAVFMPHGLGHLLGIDTHDPGGYPEGLERPKEPGLSSLRTTRELKEGMVITVEPGCYFIDTLLTKVRNDPSSSKFFNWQEVEKYRSFGGVRIESDVHLVCDSSRMQEPHKLPRETWEIEAVMAGAPWPLPASSSTLAASENGVSKALS
ncbi:hypothetical protein HU200_040715 [Digitaria exilis]|uniref:Peptidase M24 domain-containing protein n=1 Tax=Digitaria exilis TaxID=1010633 RepID=A0A835EET0_9POAL|nr:hypothetical protein HU200_040715 [Digitaria exilis]